MNNRDNPIQNNNIISGRNPVTEAIRSGRNIDCIYIAKGELNGSIKVIAAMAKEKRIPIKEVERKKLDMMTDHGNHQGVAALAAVKTGARTALIERDSRIGGTTVQAEVCNMGLCQR